MYTNIKDLAILMAGHPLRGSIENTPTGDVAVVQMKDVDPELGLNKDRLFRIDVGGRKKPDYLRQDDILFIGRGYRIFAVLIDEDLDRTVAAPHFFILRIKPDKPVEPAYLAWFINHTRAQKYFARHVVGSVLPQINRSTLEELAVIVPPIETQKLIVNAHQSRLREKRILEKLIEKKKLLLDELLDQTLDNY